MMTENHAGPTLTTERVVRQRKGSEGAMVSNLSESKGLGRSRTASPAKMFSCVLAVISGQVRSTQCARPLTSVSGPESLLVNLGG